MYLCFKGINKDSLDTLPAVVFNYGTCVVLSLFLNYAELPDFFAKSSTEFLGFSIGLGFFFIGSFYLMAKATEVLGVAGSTTVSRMSMIIPASYSILFLDNPINVTMIIGFFVAFVAVYFIVFLGNSNEGHTSTSKISGEVIFIAIAVFIGLGLTDTGLKRVVAIYMDGKLQLSVMTLIYGTAFIVGLIILIINSVRNKTHFLYKHGHLSSFYLKKYVLWGILLGTANITSLYFFLKALHSNEISGGVLFPINSVGIMAVSTTLSYLIFKEKINHYKLIGLGIAVLAIVLMNWG
jgi:drug/metabolite transporter (DMT)-like permease